MVEFSEKQKDSLQVCLNEDIEVLLEEFEDVTDREIKTISLSRISFQKGAKSFEYTIVSK